MNQAVTSITAAAPNRDTSGHLNAVLTVRSHRSRITTRWRSHTVSADTSRSYVTHLIEAGWDPLFVQQQVGHEHASTTAIYTCVSSSFRTRTLRQALGATMDAALRPARRAR